MDLAPEHLPYESVPSPLCVVTRGMTLSYANPAFAEFLGLDRESVIGRSTVELAEELVAPEDRHWLNAMAQKVTEGGSGVPVLWVRLRHRNDRAPQMIHCLLREGPRPGERVLVLSPAETEKKVADFAIALAAGAERLMRCRDERAVLDMAAQVIFDNGLWASVMLVKGDRVFHGPVRQDPQALAMAEQLYGKPIHEVSFPLEAMPHITEQFRTGRGRFHHNFSSLAKALHTDEVKRVLDGLPPVRAVEAPLIVGEEHLGVLTAIGPELTPAMGAAVELFAQQVSAAVENARHHRRAEVRLEELQRLQNELVQKSRLAALGEAAAVMAHEVRNPLGAILNGFALFKKQQPVMNPEATGLLEMVEEESQRLERIVHDLLDFNRPMNPKPTTVDVGELVQRTVRVLRERKQDDGVNIEVSAAPAITVFADGQLLQLAVQNLIRNAVQASPRNGLVKVSVEPSSEGVRVAVQDEGAGIADGDAQRIFDPFFTTRATGTGLGLPMVRRVAEAHRGRVELKATGTGARFELIVPAR